MVDSWYKYYKLVFLCVYKLTLCYFFLQQSTYTGQVQKLVNKLEGVIDPFDMDVFSPHLQANLNRHSNRCMVSLCLSLIVLFHLKNNICVYIFLWVQRFIKISPLVSTSCIFTHNVKCVQSHQNDAHVRSYIILIYSFYLCPWAGNSVPIKLISTWISMNGVV